MPIFSYCRFSTLLLSVQLFVEEAQEFQTGIDDSRYRQRAQRSRAPVVKLETTSSEESPKADSIQKMMLWYCRCLQHGMQVCHHKNESKFAQVFHQKNSCSYSVTLTCVAQELVSMLQTQCGLGTSLSSVVRRIWLANLAESGILTQNFSRHTHVLVLCTLSVQFGSRQKQQQRKIVTVTLHVRRQACGAVI